VQLGQNADFHGRRHVLAAHGNLWNDQHQWHYCGQLYLTVNGAPKPLYIL
jgi:hypothetical protein